jgi:hypothetical protein
MTNCTFYSSANLAEYRIHDHSATANDRQALDKIPGFFDDYCNNIQVIKVKLDKN